MKMNLSLREEQVMKKQCENSPRESFVFYRSYYKAILTLSMKNRLKVYDAIVEYALNHKIPEDLPKHALGIFEMVKPNVDACNRNYFKRIERKKQKDTSNFGREVNEKVLLPEMENEPFTDDSFEDVDNNDSSFE